MRPHPCLILLALALAAPPPVRAQEPPRPKTSEELINAALAAGKLTEEIAYKYRIFALFGDTRLPAQYRGTGDGAQVSPHVLDRAGQLMKSFSAQTQAELTPFYLRPGEPGSWVTLRTIVADPISGGTTAAPDTPAPGNGPAAPDPSPAGAPPSGPNAGLRDYAAPGSPWITLPAVGGKVKVWAQRRYPGDSAKAAAIAVAMTSTIWPRLVGRFWEPLNDQRFNRMSVLTGQLEAWDIDRNNGGGPEFDIYLVHFPPGSGPGGQELGGIAPAALPSFACGQNPRYVVLESRRPLGGARSSGILNTLAHEFMHAISHARPWADQDCDQFRWILEATGKWSEDFVYPDAQSEQPAAPDFLMQPWMSLDDPGPGWAPGAGQVTPRMYGAYVLPFYLARVGGQEAALPAMWEKFEALSPLPGINAALTGTSLEKLFPQFAVANWNQPPVDDYNRKDKLTEGARMLGSPYQVSTSGGAVYTKTMPVNLHYLAASYHHFKMDPNVRAVTFSNELYGHPNASVWALQKIKGTWKDTTDLTGESGKTWCRDVDAEDLEELVIIFVDKAWPKTSTDRQRPALLDLKSVDPPVLKAYPTGCNAWVGTTFATFTQDEPTLGALRETMRSSIRFVVDSSMLLPGSPPEYWKATLATIHWTTSATGGGCTGSFGGTLSYTLGGDDNPLATLRIWAPEDGGPMRHAGWQGPMPDAVEPVVSYACQGGPPLTMNPFLTGTWFHTDPGGHAVSADGKTLTGTWEVNLTPVSKVRVTWTLRPGP